MDLMDKKIAKNFWFIFTFADNAAPDALKVI